MNFTLESTRNGAELLAGDSLQKTALVSPDERISNYLDTNNIYEYMYCLSHRGGVKGGKILGSK